MGEGLATTNQVLISRLWNVQAYSTCREWKTSPTKLKRIPQRKVPLASFLYERCLYCKQSKFPASVATPSRTATSVGSLMSHIQYHSNVWTPLLFKVKEWVNYYCTNHEKIRGCTDLPAQKNTSLIPVGYMDIFMQATVLRDCDHSTKLRTKSILVC